MCAGSPFAGLFAPGRASASRRSHARLCVPSSWCYPGPFDMKEPQSSSDDDTPSTGFLPLSLALALFITGLFTLGIIPGTGCEPPASAFRR
jgi:hypothetical protein